MKRYAVIGRKKAVWVLLGFGLYLFVIFLGLGQMIYSFVSSGQKELPIYSVKREDKVVALTFNCAFDPDNTPEILAVLKEKNVKATFFVVGEWAAENPEAVKEIVAAGHSIGGHSYSHINFVGASEESIKKELARTDKIVKELTGQTIHLVRVPYGEYDTRVIKLIRQQGYEAIQWSADSVDWENPTDQTITERVMKKTKEGGIVLFHTGCKIP